MGVYLWTERNIQTFDFQNDWSLNWTAWAVAWTPDYVNWQGWRLYRSDQDSEGRVTPPTSIFDNGTLKKIRLRMYKGIATTWNSSRAYYVGAGVWCGNNSKFIWSYGGANINYDRLQYRVNNTQTYIHTANITGEVLLELNLEWTTPILTINSNTYTLTWSISSEYQEYWTNKTMPLIIWNRRWWSGDIYIRKVEFTTV